MLKLLRIGAAFCAAAFLCSCSTPTTTGAKTDLSVRALSQVSNLGVKVVVAKDLSVVLARDQMVNAGFMAGGVTGALIEHGVHAGTDARTASKLRPLLGDLDCQRFVTTSLLEKLKNTGRFKSVVPVGANAPVDAVLTVNISSWGLRTGMSEDPTRKAQTALDAHVLLTQTGASTPLWERNDYFPAGSVHGVNEFSESQTLLRKEVEAVLDRYSDRLVNEIRFAK